MVMNIAYPQDLFFDQLKDLYSVESQVILTLPELAEQAHNKTLRRLLAEGEGASVRQKQRLTTIFKHYAVDPGGDICKAMKGLIDGGNEHLAQTEDTVVRDLLLVAHTNRILHYEIAAYSFTATLAECAGFTREAGELQESLEEERAMARQLASAAAEIFGTPAGVLQ
jgi:ferritin-like metal-binding protein YciE